jgi:hypothetical protein
LTNIYFDMAIPDTDNFNEIMASLKLEAPDDTDEYFFKTCISEQDVINPYNQQHTNKHFTLFYSASSTINLDALTTKIIDEANKVNMRLTTESAETCLVTYLLTRNSENPPNVDEFNKLFESVITCDLTQIQLINTSIPHLYSLPLKFGEFYTGPLIKDKIRYLAEKAGSDFAQSYTDHFPSSSGMIMRDHIKVKTLHFRSLVLVWNPHFIKSQNHSSLVEFLYNYFLDSITKIYFDDFKELLQERQDLLVSMGACISPNDESGLLLGIENTHLSVFLNYSDGSPGWVQMGAVIKNIDIVENANERTNDAHKYFSEISGTDVHAEFPGKETYSIYCRFLSLAGEYSDENNNLATLHYVIALELMLGTQGQSTSSVAERSAIIIHQALGISFDEACKQIKKLYDQRSKYVHEGKPIDPELRSESYDLCKIIAATFINAAFGKCSEFSHDAWILMLDHCISHQKLHNRLPSETSRDAGIRSTFPDNIIPGPEQESGL